jgi:hypothetical protein
MSTVLYAKSHDEYIKTLPRFNGGGLTALVLPIADYIGQQNPRVITQADGRDAIKSSEVPALVRDTAIHTINTHSTPKLSPNAKIIKNPPIFGRLTPITGVHTDLKSENGFAAEGIGVLGTWFLVEGAARLLLKQAASFDPSEISQELEELSDETTSPQVTGHNIIKADRIGDFLDLTLTGPHIVSWAIGMSPDKEIPTVFHQIESVRGHKRLSTNIYPHLFKLF